MKPKISREEAKELLIYDSYFKKENYCLIIWQTIVAVLGWFGVLLPFVWVFLPFIFPHLAKENHFSVYKEEIVTFNFLLVLLSIIFLVILISYIGLTFWNNQRFKKHLQRRKQYNEEQLDMRRELLNDEYERRFGTEYFRKNIRFYSVKEKQNFDTNEIRKLYKEGGVKL